MSYRRDAFAFDISGADTSTTSAPGKRALTDRIQPKPAGSEPPSAAVQRAAVDAPSWKEIISSDVSYVDSLQLHELAAAGTFAGTPDRPTAHEAAHVQRKEADAADKTIPSRRVENAYRHMFHNQRAGLTRLGAALKKDSKPDTSLLGEIVGTVVGQAIGALLGPAGKVAVSLATSPKVKELVGKIAEAVTAKAVEVGTETAKDKFRSTKTDAADNFIEAQSLALNQAEHDAVQDLLDQTEHLDAVDGPGVLTALARGVDQQAAHATDLQVAHSAGGWARTKAPKGPRSGVGANDGDIEIEAAVNINYRLPITIIGSNWRGIGKETEGVVQEHTSARIGDIGAPLHVTLYAPSGPTWFRVDGDTVYTPTSGSARNWLIHAAQGAVDPQAKEDELEAGARNSAKAFAYQLFAMPVTKLKSGR